MRLTSRLICRLLIVLGTCRKSCALIGLFLVMGLPSLISFSMSLFATAGPLWEDLMDCPITLVYSCASLRYLVSNLLGWTPYTDPPTYSWKGGAVPHSHDLPSSVRLWVGRESSSVVDARLLNVILFLLNYHKLINWD